MSWTITPQTKVPVDPYRSQVSLLLHGDGANGSTTITDSSPTPKTVTAVGNAQISTAQSKFGGASIAFDGAGDYLSIPTSSAFAFGTQDFTVEAWVNTTKLDQVIFDNRTVEEPGVFFIQATTGRIAYYDPATFLLAGSTTNCANGAWNHLAWSRSGSTFRMFVNGTQEYSGNHSSNYSTTTRPARIGLSYNSAAAFLGYIDDLRITKGVARYTANFTPPTAPFPDI